MPRPRSASATSASMALPMPFRWWASATATYRSSRSAVLVVDVVEHEDDAGVVDGVHGAVVDRSLELRLGVFGEADQGDQRASFRSWRHLAHTHVR